MNAAAQSARFSVRVEPQGRVVACAPDATVLDACLEAGLDLPYNCRSGECGECKVRLLEGEVYERPGADPAILSAAERSNGVILSCMSVPSGTLQVLTIRCDGNPAEAAAAIRVGGTGSSPVLTRGVVDRIAHAGESIRVVTVRLERPVDYRPGQYFEWILPGITPNRAYSAANPPGSKQLEFHVRLHPAGQVSDRLSTGALAQGDSIGLKGPFGHFGLSSEARPALLIAGGTGMAPVKAMLEAAFARGDRRSLRFFYGARRQDELYTADMLNLWMVKMPNFEFVPVLSDEPPGGSWTGGRGRVTDIVAERVHDVLGFEAYLCGPPGMIDAATALLLARGLDPADLHVDRFTAAA